MCSFVQPKKKGDAPRVTIAVVTVRLSTCNKLTFKWKGWQKANALIN